MNDDALHLKKISEDKKKKCLKNLKSLKSGKFSKIFFPLFGLFALTWIVFRVTTKPSRAGYPCVKSAAPVAAGFIYYLMGIAISALSLQKAKKLFKNARYFAAFVFAAVGIFSVIHLYSIDSKPAIANTIQYDVPNNPIGNGMGIFPGRVIWAHNPDATNENCSNSWDDGFFLEKNSDLQVIEEMVTKSVLQLTGQSSVSDAWDSLFVNFNQRHNKGKISYTTGEKIFIKTNGVGTSSLNGNYEVTSLKDYKMSKTSPQPVLVILRQLINDCGIAQTDISVGDPMTNIIKEYYEIWTSEFPDVNYIDSRGTNGRTKSEAGSEPRIFYSDRGDVLRTGEWKDASIGDPVYEDHIYTVLEEADYMINIAALKAHARAGITLCAKSHFGSHTRIDAKHLHMGLVSPDNGNPTRSGYGKYRIQVDIMGHELLGGNTMLFMVDGLWGGSEAVDPPCKFKMTPFNNDWPSSIFMSQDQVALESVCLDFLKTEFTEDNPLASWPQYEGVDDYLQQAADTSKWPENIKYDPENDGTPLNSLGVQEHWNNAIDKQYSRNLGETDGIELIKITDVANSIEQNLNIGSVGEFELFQNFPNPFNPTTTISYSLETSDKTILIIYDNTGKKIKDLMDADQTPGYYKTVWNGRDMYNRPVSSGIYFAALKSGPSVRVIKLMLVR
jgi:hypothetical protein